MAAAPTYNGSTDFTATAGVAHGTTGSLTTGGSVSVAGLVNGQTLGGFSLDSANVVGASKVTGVSLTGGIDARNYVLNGSAFGSAAAVTAGANPDGTAATNVAAIAAAPLGVALDAVYNGTTRFTSTGGATNAAAGSLTTGGSLAVAGLMGSERLTEVTVSDANADVVTAGKSVTAAAGSNGFVASNYALRVGANSSVAGGAITSANNTVAITPAPLGVAVTGTYDGSTTYSLGQGDTRIAAFGLVGRDASVQLTTATLASRNAGTNRVVSIAGPAGFNPANYVLNGSLNITPETAGTAADGSGATNAAVIAQRRITVLADDKSKTFGRPDPEFTYRVSEGSLVAGDSLSGELSRTPGEALGTRPISAAGLTNGNYAITALDGQLTIVAPVQPPPPPTPIIVPAFIDNGSSVLGSAVQPPSFGGLNYVRESGSQGGAPIAPQGARPNAGAEQTPGGRSSLNFVSGAPADADGPDNRAGAAAPGAAGGEQTGTGRSTLNFVSSSSTENAPATGGEGGKRKAAQELNVNNVTVPSSSGPLDVFVIDSGINASGVGTLNSLNTQ